MALDDFAGAPMAVGRSPQLHPQGRLRMGASTRLSWRWLPRRIVATLRRMWPHESSLHISDETIGTAMYAHAGSELRRQLTACLRQGKSTRRRRSAGEDRPRRIPKMFPIHVRPPEVEDRVMRGHREGDLIKGAVNRSTVGVPVLKHMTRLVLPAKKDDATAMSALKIFGAKFAAVTAPLRQRRTDDQGRQLASHRVLTERGGVKVCFFDPYSRWQRGTCKGSSALLRRYLPKGIDRSMQSQADLDAITDKLNNPVACHPRVALAAARLWRDAGRSRSALHFSRPMTWGVLHLIRETVPCCTS